MTLLLYFLKPLLLTVAIEALAGVCMRLDGRAQLALLRCNLITNPTLALIILITSYVAPGNAAAYWCVLLPLEVAIVFAESRLLTWQLDAKKNWTLVSLFANGASFLCGLIISFLSR